MSPAFSSPRQAAAFALLLALILLSPLLVGRSVLPDREQLYASISWRVGAYPYLQEQIFQQKGDIDIAIIGSSHIQKAIDTPQIQQQLSQKLGRPATVITLTYNYPGLDPFFFITRDLLQHRKVGMIVMYDDLGQDAPHRLAWHLVRWGDDAAELQGLPVRYQATYYYGAILGMPRNLLNMLRPSLPMNQTEREKTIIRGWFDCLPWERMGAAGAKVGYEDKPYLFVPYTPQVSASPSDFLIYSASTASSFQPSDRPHSFLQSYFAGKIVELARSYKTKLVCLSLPSYDERGETAILEDAFWPFKTDVTFVGIPPAKLFAGMSDDDVRKLFYNPGHMNINGQEYFTPLVAPSLIDLYEQTKP